MSVFEANIETILRSHPDFKRTVLSSNTPSRELTVVEARDGSVTASYRGVYLHSRHSPPREAARLIEASGQGPSAYWIFLGFGLGYLPEECSRLYPDANMIIVEPDLPLFLGALSIRDLTKLLSSKRVTLVLAGAPGVPASLLQEAGSGSVRIVTLRSTYPAEREYYEQVMSALSSYLSRRQINRNTLARFGRLWIRNLSANLYRAASAPGIVHWRGTMAGIPAIVLAAGPSLDRVLPILEDIRRRAVVICVDTSLKGCLRAGVTPDFTVVVDPQYWNTRHLDRCEAPGTILVSESSTHPRTFRLLEGETFFCSSLFPLGEYIESRLGEYGKIGAGGSVSTTAWDFARYLGCRPIYCAGLDLGFPSMATHFKGSTFEERTLSFSDRFSPQELYSFKALHDAGPYPVPNNCGSVTYTDQRLIVYKGWFEGQISGSGIESYNCSPEGVRIEGIPFTPAESITELPEVRDRIDAVLLGRRGVSRRSRREELEEIIRTLVSDLSAIRERASRGIAILEGAGACELSEDALGELDSIDAEILGSDGRDVAGFLLHGTASDIIDTAPSDVISASETLYRELRESAAYHIELLKLSLERPK